jgi:hypothetical protein
MGVLMLEHEVRNIIRATCRVHKVPITDERVMALAHQAVTTCASRNAMVDFLRDELRKPEFAESVLTPAPENE